ncbi:nuclear body protein SP140-like protein isoform X2 [Electrophorus electricus]|nr:nuclear body protein SP140-like protein isoform X2 [Electrophorus electricus]
MSCMEQPNTFLNQLRDYDLVPEKLYKKVIRMRCKEKKKDGVYEILDRLEKERSDEVKVFWRCVFHDHILQKYPVLSVLRNSLMDGSYKSCVKRPDSEELTDSPQSEENTAKRQRQRSKRKKSVDEAEDDEQPGPSSSSSSSQQKSPKKLKFSSPVKRGEKVNIWTFALFKTQLPVTCGDKEATLYRDKLAKGGACLLSQGRWFTPSDFEQFAGKGSYKNWKLSIRCQNTPLQNLIKEGHLNCPRMKRKYVQKSQKQLFTQSSSESSSPTSSEEMEESVGQEELRGEQDEEEEQEEEEDDDEEEEEGGETEEGEAVDLSEFQAPSLPVSCGSVSGVLFKSRFASGTRGKSIRTEECWFTPEEFMKQELTLTDGCWKRDIKCHGKTLSDLLPKILKVHSLLCKCDLCGPTEQELLDQDNDDECFICNSDGHLVCCDECPRAFHDKCHIPTLHAKELGNKWMCTYCVLKNSQCWWRHRTMTEEQALNSPVSQYIVHCDYLLLCMYKEDTQRVFSKDPSTMVRRYREFIAEPMWLDRVKDKLHSQKYETLRHFVSDISLIFQNCNTFNRDNHLIITMGSTLNQMFEQEFKTIFNIQ